MKISLNWLKDYIDLPKNVTPEKLAHDLTMSTVEVEGVISLAQRFEGMVLGKVMEIKKHPDADKLQLAMTDIGGEKKQIVCGGTNLFEGMLVAVALPGAKVKWHGEGELVTLEKTKIRGEESFGMICASSEIGLGDVYPNTDKEILNLSKCDKEAGTPLSEALGLNDIVFEIDNKSLTNRPDLWSHYGIAREIAAIYKLKIKEPKLEKIKFGKSKQLKVSLKSKACRAYLGVVLENIEIKPSPDWLQARLVAVGLRPINNLVDLTNYVMLDVGEPMHAFDYENISGGNIVVRQANENEVLETLEGESRDLSKDECVISDNKQAIALAGIKGGKNSGINQNSNKVIIEAANFDPIIIRKTSTKFNFRTDASVRHEKALDLERPEIGLARFLELLNKILPAAKVDNVVKAGETVTEKVKIDTNLDFIVSRLGQNLKIDEIKEILENLGFGVKTKADNLVITVPHWRATGDVSIPEDIVEEVGRIYGYDNLALKSLRYEVTRAVYQPKQVLQKRIKLFLANSAGLFEIYNYPWAEDKYLQILDLDKNLVELDNPPAQTNKFLQSSLLPNFLKAVETNARFSDEFGLFELARVFLSETRVFGNAGKDKLPEQPKYLIGGKYSATTDVYLQVKGIVEELFADLNITNFDFEYAFDQSLSFLEKQSSVVVTAGGKKVGYFGNLSNQVINKLDLKAGKKNLCVFEIDLEGLFSNMEQTEKFQALPQYPGVSRDLAFELDKKIVWHDLKEQVLKISLLIKNIEFLSIYDLGDKKSLAFRVEYLSDEKTLTSEEVEKIELEIVKMVQEKFKGNLRK